MHSTLQTNSSATRQRHISAQKLGLQSHDVALPGVFLRKFSHDVFNRDNGQRWKRTRMSLSMAYQSWFLREGLSANITDVRPLPRVDQYVLLLRRLSPKGLAAHRTGKRFHARVDPHVRVKVTSTEPFAAGRTKDLLSGLVPGQVLLKILLRGHPSPAYLADKLGLVMTILHMRLQGVQVFTEVAAHVADYGRGVTVILLDVMIQGLLDLELLAASVAGEVEVAGVKSYEVVLQGALVLALVVADAALEHLRPVNLLDVRVQVTFQAEGLDTLDTPVPVLLQVLGEVALLEELLSTVIALHARFRPLSTSFSR